MNYGSFFFIRVKHESVILEKTPISNVLFGARHFSPLKTTNNNRIIIYYFNLVKNADFSKTR